MIRPTPSRVFALAAAALVLSLAVPATSAAGDTGWQLRLNGAWVSPSVDYTRLDGDGNPIRVESANDLAYGLALEYRISRRIGCELGAVFAKPDIEVKGEADGGQPITLSEGVRFTPVTLGLNVHLTPDGPVDVYAGPVVAYAFFGDVTYELTVGGETESLTLESDNDLAFGATVGVDLALGDAWSLGAAVTYLDTSWEATELEWGESDTVGFDPLIVTFGARYRF